MIRKVVSKPHKIQLEFRINSIYIVVPTSLIINKEMDSVAFAADSWESPKPVRSAT